MQKLDKSAREGQKVIARFPSSRLVQVGSVTAVLPPIQLGSDKIVQHKPQDVRLQSNIIEVAGTQLVVLEPANYTLCVTMQNGVCCTSTQECEASKVDCAVMT